MPNLTIMAANAAAAVEPSRLSRSDRTLLVRYARETCGDYCAGCGLVCSRATGNEVPIHDVMRCLMYAHSYHDVMLARSTFDMLPARARALLAQADFTEAERCCPRNLPIGRLVKEAADLLA
jgi:hypothetical protein